MKKGASHFRVNHDRLASLSLAAILLFVTFLNVPGVHVAHASTVTLPGGSLTTTDFNAWSVNTLVFDTYFDFSAGPTTITVYGLDLTDIWYEGVWPWPPVPNSLGAQARFGITVDGFWSRHQIHSAIGNGDRSWDQQTKKWTHDDGFRKYLIQNQFSGTNPSVTLGNHQYNVEAYIPRSGAGPSINDPAQVTDREYNTFDMKITYTPTGTPGTYQVQGKVRLHKAASTTEMNTSPGNPRWGLCAAAPAKCPPYTWVWNKAINNQANPENAWVPFFDGSWTVTGFQNPVRPFVEISNWGVPQTRYHTFSWSSIVIDGTITYRVDYAQTGCDTRVNLALPSSEWVHAGDDALGVFPPGPVYSADGETRCTLLSYDAAGPINAPTTRNGNYKTEYSVSFAVAPSGSGTTSPSLTDWYDAGATITISATANLGYAFTSWSPSTQSITIASPSSASTTATINGAGTMTANFISPKSIKQNVLDDLTALRGTISDKEDGKKLDETIKHLTKSLDPELWTDETHLQAKHGEKVFNEEKDAVVKLLELIKDKKSTIPDATLQGFINRLVSADKLLASTAISDAAGGDAKKIDKANEELSKGDARALDGKFVDAIEHYRNAWIHAVKAV